ncbi:hypothetical protein [Halomarina rubra]|uniref:Integral membrane protein n=1 Tax=Halomarina rubra TaxID=2071873 RepID=A0ABD6AVK1_9EURY|nr:hypothetical protein [Halomarina rubra]
MSVRPARESRETRDSSRGTRSDRWLAAGLVVLAVALAVNTILGPLVASVVTYPFSETLVNQTVGLEAVSLFVVAPWCLLAAWLITSGHRAGPVVAIPPAAYAAYMFVQYVVGPGYLTYRPVVALHLSIFVLSGAVLLRAWADLDDGDLPTLSQRRRRTASGVLVILGAFVCLQYLGAVEGLLTAGPLSAEASADPTMYWSIFFLDLGVVVPVTLATALSLLRGASWANRALYGVAGWYLFVPISVATMGVVMLLNDDPNAAVGRVVVLSIAGLLFAAFTVWVYRPLFADRESREDHRGRVGT